MKLQAYRQTIITLIFFLLGLVIGRFQLKIFWETNDSETFSESLLLNIPTQKPLPISPTKQIQEFSLLITTSQSSIIRGSKLIKELFELATVQIVQFV
ncbi:hypothetical protein [Okeania sp. SIO2C2]|uniref:hypothetical protein n=1 Tax=Okeania sp. SIO2C2 TaxID=2607787 RepID=UPI002579CC84|nr:hypothetical protein [Okeania sp. SIO2C2]